MNTPYPDTPSSGHAHPPADAVDQAIAAGCLPAGARGLPALWAADPPWPTRPWPITVMSAIGAWFVSLPAVALLALLLGSALRDPAGALVLGLMVVAGSTALLRQRELPAFAEQLALAFLLGALGLTTWGFMDLSRSATGALLQAGLLLATGLALNRPAHQVLMGVFAAMAATVGLGPDTDFYWRSSDHFEIGWRVPRQQLAMLLGLAVLALAHRARRASWLQGQPAAAGQRRSLTLQRVAVGVVVGGLLWTAFFSGRSWLAMGLDSGLGTSPMGSLGRDLGIGTWSSMGRLRSPEALLSGSLGLLALAAALRTWPELNRRWGIASGLVLLPLGLMLPWLGAVLLALVVCAGLAQRLVALLAALVTVWVLGTFYDNLAWPLMTKGAVLVAIGLALLVPALLARVRRWQAAQDTRDVAEAARAAPARHAPALILLSLGLCLALVNTGIWRNEQLLARARTVVLPLAPVDPRSLVGGDYMALAFAMPRDAASSDLLDHADGRLWAVARLPAQGPGRLERLSRTLPTGLAPDEWPVELRLGRNGWTVNDGFHFAEGQADALSHARFGEFRIDGAGRSVLVRMLDGLQQPLGLPPKPEGTASAP